ncbi:MAG: KTSC domain-containing protein [Actinobacteria bacterium]|nr:KTSC domain-containing protein [Actinomycetota bacterium]
MLMIPLRSKALAEAGYDPAAHVLRVHFRNGRTYDYLDVPPDVWAGLRTSAHPWTEWGEYIKENFDVGPAL